MQKNLCRTLLVGALLFQCGLVARADDEKPVFENDCISFAGRGLANAPVKKKVYPGMAVDGTVWSVDPGSKKVVISKVIPGEDAEKNGVEVGDSVVTINGYNTDGQTLRQLCFAYHMYEPTSLKENIVLQKKDGTQKTLKLQCLTVDKCAPEEKAAWAELYKAWGY